MPSRPDMPTVAVSACLLGRAVRWDGGHKRHPGVLALSRHVEWIAVCPEEELGLGVPREPIVFHGGRLRAVHSRVDLTDAMRTCSEARLDELVARGIQGYVFKARSPSCGLNGARGLFARLLLERLPALPVVEEEELEEAAAREAFLAQVRAYRPARRKNTPPHGR